MCLIVKNSRSMVRFKISEDSQLMQDLIDLFAKLMKILAEILKSM